jgi:dienelactone hydrolase
MRRVVALLAVFLSAGAFAQQPAPPVRVIPVEAFTRFDLFAGMKISQDGKAIAVLGGEQGRSRLTFIDLVDKKVVSGVSTHGRERIGTYQWIGGQVIYTLEHNHASQSERHDWTDELYAVDRDGTGHWPIFHGETVTLLRTSGREPDRLIVAETPLRSDGWYFSDNPEGRVRVYGVNARGTRPYSPGRMDTSPLSGGRVLLDRNDKVRMALGSNEHRLPAVGWKPDADGAWQTFDLDGFHRERAEPVSFGADDRSALLTGVRLDQEFSALYRLDLSTRQASKIFGFADADVIDVIRDFADQEVVGVRGYRERSVEHWLAPDHLVAKTYAALQRAFPGQRVRITSASADGQRAIVFVDSDINPGDYYLFDTKRQHAEFLRATRTWIDPRSMQPKQPITLASRDGLQLHGYVTRPAADGPAPLVVLPHDGPWSERDQWEFDSEVQLLANRGYAVLQVNYRGTTGYGVAFERAGDGEWGGKIQNDIADATRWAIAQGIARADRVCIYGKGYGGYAAAMSVVREPDLFRCAIGYGVVYDFTDEANPRELWALRQMRKVRVLGADVAKLRALSLLRNASNINSPVLLIHGKHDRNVVYDQFKQMQRTVKRADKKNVEFMTLPREGSDLYDEKTRREVYERILQFLAANLSAPPGTP